MTTAPASDADASPASDSLETTPTDVAVLRAEVRRLRAELVRERERTEHMRMRALSAEADAAVSAAQMRELRGSSSWRITAPLRSIASRASSR